MAIHPIDLSAVYSQMDNVAKFNASQNQIAQAENQQGRDRTAQENLQKSKTVQNAAQNDIDSTVIKNNLNQGSSQQGQYAKKKKNDSDDEVDKPVQQEITDPLLGRHIDITG